jgi:3-hydroxyisobutyrate dehydrogenase-like beta-hydroxyacid dehydrogenase
MGSALAERLLENGHQVSVWNRTPGRTAPLERHGARVAPSVDDLVREADAVFICLADDRSTLDLATPEDRPRAAWSDLIVVNTGTVAPETNSRLRESYGERFIAAPIVGAPAAVRGGAAGVILGGPDAAREALASVWEVFEQVSVAGTDPAQASIIKLLHNHLLLAGMAVVAETVRIGRGAGVADDVLAGLLRQASSVPVALRNRIESLFDPQHPGWFTSQLAAKDLGHASALAPGDPLPVTEAARMAYLQTAASDWADADITAIIETGRH